MDPLEIVVMAAANMGSSLLTLWLVSAVGPLRGLATVLARRVVNDLKNSS